MPAMTGVQTLSDIAQRAKLQLNQFMEEPLVKSMVVTPREGNIVQCRIRLRENATKAGEERFVSEISGKAEKLLRGNLEVVSAELQTIFMDGRFGKQVLLTLKPTAPQVV